MKNCKLGAESPCGKLCCCFDCPSLATCQESCDTYNTKEEAVKGCVQIFDVDDSLQVFQTNEATVIRDMVSLLRTKKKLEDDEKTLREKFIKAMETYGIKSLDNGLITVTYVPASTKTILDTKRLKAENPDIYKTYGKPSSVKASVRFSLKEG